ARDERKAPAPEAPQEGPALIGKSPTMQRLFRTLGRVAASDLAVLITGESGSGKEVVARAVHAKSRRHDRPFVAVNMAAIPPELAEAELFGHEKGAFTGADRARGGLFEQAHGGTLFLDEIGDMPMPLQTKLLRVLEDGVIYRLGGRRPIRVNVRLIAATHQNLARKVAEGAFREDLYYRLNVIPVHVPPLRERREDIPLLAEHWLAHACRALGFAPPPIEPAAMEVLVHYDWPGNVRELRNVMHRLAVLVPGPSITAADVALALGHAEMTEPRETVADAVSGAARRYLAQLGGADRGELYRDILAQVEPALLSVVLEHTRGHQLRAARLLGVNRNTLRSMLRRHGLDPSTFK
ncbi:MAG: sigma-54-dependent Fis family transcriptional regulator, partial [Zetaproteobacteria bacterium]